MTQDAGGTDAAAAGSGMRPNSKSSVPTGYSDRLLEGKGVVITGAGRGIGKAIAVGYARAGAAVCCAARTKVEIDGTVSDIRAAGGQAFAVSTDVSQWSSVQRLFAAARKELDSIDIVVANAGIDHRGNIEDSSPEDWEETVRVNLLGAYHCAKAAIPFMKERGGKIITTGSGMGHKGMAGSSAYSCSKAGLWMLTRVLAQELSQYHISVNELIPGPVETDLSSSRDPGSVFEIAGEWIKSPEDVVPLALFLATQPDVGPTAQSYSLMRRDD